MKEDHLKAIRVRESVKLLRDRITPREKFLVDLAKAKADVRFIRTSENAQLLLELQIHSAKAEIAFLNKRAGN
jgi:hypothetical protein